MGFTNRGRGEEDIKEGEGMDEADGSEEIKASVVATAGCVTARLSKLVKGETDGCLCPLRLFIGFDRRVALTHGN